MAVSALATPLPGLRVRAEGDLPGAFAPGRTVVVPDVHAFPGHIACDSASNSELVVPLLKEERVLGVIDLDSPSTNRFDSDDQRGVEALAKLLVDACSW